MKKFFTLYDQIVENILSLLYFFLIVIIFFNVISRYFINMPFMWAEELGRYLFIWIVYLGAAQAFKNNRHLVVDYLINKIPEPLKTYLDLTIQITLILFISFLFYYGVKFAMFGRGRASYSFNLGLSFFYAAIPVGSMCMLLNILRIIPDTIKRLKNNKKRGSE